MKGEYLMKKIFRNIHLWLSVPFGLIITLTCFSGAMLVFEDEITQHANRELYYVEKVGKKTIPMQELADSISTRLTDGITITGITVYPNPQRTYQVNLSKPRRAAIYVDPYTGEVKGQSQRLPFFRTMFSLHRWLLDNRPTGDGIFWGKIIVGTSTLMFVFVLLSGVVIWWPHNRKGLKKRLKISMHKGLSRFWYDLHVAGGIYALIVILAMALTGLTWSFEWYRNAFYSAFGVEMKANPRDKNISSEEKTRTEKGKDKLPMQQRTHGKESDFLYWQPIYDRLAKENPDNRQITISNGEAQVSNNRLGNIRGTDHYSFDPQSGEITGVSRYKNAEKAGKIRGWIYSVHVGSWGGTTTRILWFLISLLGASLPLTGYYLWIKRLYQKNGKRIVH